MFMKKKVAKPVETPLPQSKVVFTPQPVGKSDVVWIDKEGGQYFVHSQVLSIRSPVFCGLVADGQPLHLNHSRQVLLSFLQSLYSEVGQQGEKIFEANILEVWGLAYQYQCTNEKMYQSYIMQRLSQNTIPWTGDAPLTVEKILQFAGTYKMIDVAVEAWKRLRIQCYIRPELIAGFDQKSLARLAAAACGLRVPAQHEVIMADAWPIEGRDVMWIDSEGGEHLVYSQVLCLRSAVLRAREWKKGERVTSNHTGNVLSAFFRVLYGGHWDDSLITQANVLDVWPILHEFQCSIEGACIAFITSNLDKMSLKEGPAFSVKRVLRTARTVHADHVVELVCKTVLQSEVKLEHLEILDSEDLRKMLCLSPPYLSRGSVVRARQFMSKGVVIDSDYHRVLVRFLYPDRTDRWFNRNSEELSPWTQ